MITSLGRIEIWGLPIALYFGIITFVCLVITATLGYLFMKGVLQIPFAWHMRMAGVTIFFTLIHIMLVIFQFFF